MEFWSLQGLTAYEEVRELQLKLVELRAAGRIADTVLFLEHEPVITQGRGLQFTGTPRPRHMPVPLVLPSEISFAESERGGDLTYHGPGQLVIYPICKLDGNGLGPWHDIAGFLRKMEGLLIRELAAHGLIGTTRESATGVWVGDRKIASLGIAVRRWVTYHGLAINWVNDLKPFHLISPCGFNPEVMTSLATLLPAGDADADAYADADLRGQPSCSFAWREALEIRLARDLAMLAGHGSAPLVESLTLAQALARAENPPPAQVELASILALC